MKNNEIDNVEYNELVKYIKIIKKTRNNIEYIFLNLSWYYLIKNNIIRDNKIIFNLKR